MYSSSYGTERGAFLSVAGDTINLSAPVPTSISDNFIPGTSVVQNLYGSCGSYLYSAASSQYVPQTWTEYSATITGAPDWESYSSFGCARTFRPNSRYARILLLLNYSQDANSTIEWDDITFEEVQEDEPFRYELYSDDVDDVDKLSTSTTTDETGATVWERTGLGSFETNELFPIDTDKTYRVSGEFRTAPGSAETGTTYLGIRMYDQARNKINATKHNRYGNDATISNWNNNSITTEETLSSWFDPTGEETRAALAFFYSGNTDQFPDYTWADSGVYSTVSGTTIPLTKTLPSEVSRHLISGTSIVKSIRTGGNPASLLTINSSSTYPGTSYRPEIPTNWTRFSAEITGPEVWGSSSSYFHKKTGFATFSVLFNESAATATTQLRNLKIETVEDGSHTEYDSAPIWTAIAQQNRHLAKNYGAIYSTGRNDEPRGAMEFDGENDYLEIDTPDELDFSTEDFTIAFWMKADQTPSGGGTGASYRPAAAIIDRGTGSLIDGYGVWFDKDNQIVFITDARNTEAGLNAVESSTTISLDRWTHVTVRVQNGTKNIFIDGTLDAATGTTGGEISESTRSLFIGRSDVDSTCAIGGECNVQNFRGSISDVRIYDRALTASEISELADTTPSIASTGALSAINIAQSATPGQLFWDWVTRVMKKGAGDGSVETIETPSTHLRTSEIQTLNNGNSAEEGKLYYDTDEKRLYWGQSNGTIIPVSD